MGPTSVEVMSLFQNLNDQGTTILLVTHEHDIIRYARRMVELRDGQVIVDEPVADRAVAREQLAGMDSLDPVTS